MYTTEGVLGGILSVGAPVSMKSLAIRWFKRAFTSSPLLVDD